MITGSTILALLIAAGALYMARIYWIELQQSQRANERMQRKNQKLILKNSHLLDDLDNAIEVIASEGAKRRHPTSKPALSMINGSA
jgi:hypothetical protein